MKKFLLFLTFFVIFSNALLASQINQPELSIKSANGKSFSLKNQAGKVVIVSFWISWCLDCRAEMEILKDLYKKYQNQNLEIIGVSFDDKRDRADFIKIASNLNYPNFMAIDAKINQFGEPSAFPTTYIIDKNGNVINSDILEKDKLKIEDFEKILIPLLKN